MRRDLHGLRFGRLVVVSFVDVQKKTARWLCRCDCGNELVVTRANLHQGTVRSCGCLQRSTQFHATHGLSRSIEYRAYLRMLERTNYPKHKSYPNYGGRGIKVCERWRGPSGYLNFKADMGIRPSAAYSIDRINVNGDYEPGNCRWATAIMQGRNRRNNRLITYNGETHCLSEWAELISLPRTALHERLKRGWSIERALTESNHRQAEAW